MSEPRQKLTVKEFFEIYLSFFKIGAITFGGGYAMLPILEHEVDKKKRWISKQELLDYFAMGQTLPGIIAVNVATFCGSKKGGLLGSLAAALGVVTPSIIVITVIAAFISNFVDNTYVQKFLFGMNVAVAALLVDSVWAMAKKVIIDPVTAVLAIAAFALVQFLNVHSIVMLVVGVGLGLALKWLPGRSKSKNEKKEGDGK